LNARTIIEAETPKGTFSQFPRGPQLDVGYEAISGTGITRDIISACLGTLKTIDEKAFLSEMENSDVAEYVQGGEPDFDPDYYLYEHLFNVLQEYCPPFTYFGGFEADGAIGCWPYSDMDLEEQADLGKLTIINAHMNEQAHAVLAGNYTGITTRYVIVEGLHKYLVDTQGPEQIVWEW